MVKSPFGGPECVCNSPGWKCGEQDFRAGSGSLGSCDWQGALTFPRPLLCHGGSPRCCQHLAAFGCEPVSGGPARQPCWGIGPLVLVADEAAWDGRIGSSVPDRVRLNICLHNPGALQTILGNNYVEQEFLCCFMENFEHTCIFTS